MRTRHVLTRKIAQPLYPCAFQGREGGPRVAMRIKSAKNHAHSALISCGLSPASTTFIASSIIGSETKLYSIVVAMLS